MAASKHAAPGRHKGHCDKPARALARMRGGGDNAHMNIVLNGEPRALTPPLSVLQLLQAEGLEERRVAVEVNGGIVPRSRHAEHLLGDGDRVEIVHALGGG
jgi:sulfur carrier protein